VAKDFVLEFPDLTFTHVLTDTEAQNLGDSLLAQSLGVAPVRDVVISGTWEPKKNPYGNQNHREGCGCSTCAHEREKWKAVGCLVATAAWYSIYNAPAHWEKSPAYYDILDAVATLLQR
jgi:hypothetical protein